VVPSRSYPARIHPKHLALPTEPLSLTCIFINKPISRFEVHVWPRAAVATLSDVASERAF
jgi:hypothetical protein